MAANDPTNPWSAAGWSLTEQSLYLRKYGQARAEARARDAGTTLGARPPVKSLQAPHGKYSPASLVRPGDRALYMVDKNKPYIPMRRPRDVRIAARPALGLQQATTLSFEQYLTIANDLGISADVLLTLVSASNISAAASLGITQDVLLQLEQDLAASAGLGLAQTAALDLTTVMSAAANLGITQDVLLQLEQDLAASAALGFIQTVAIQLERDLAAAPGLGIAETVVLSTSVTNSRITTDGTTRVTTDGTTRIVTP